MLLVPFTTVQAQRIDPPIPPQSPAPWTAPTPTFGAIAFTADGSFSSTWKQPSKADAEAKVQTDCARFHRGTCQVVSFGQELCAAIVSFGTPKGLKLTYAGGGLTPEVAQRTALERCKSDNRSNGECRLRTVVCGDGR